MKVTMHIYDDNGHGVFIERELEDTMDAWEIKHSSHIRIGRFSVAYNQENLAVAEAYDDNLGECPNDMRNDRVKTCRMIYAICEYYMACSVTHDTVYPPIIRQLFEAAERELHYWYCV